VLAYVVRALCNPEAEEELSAVLPTATIGNTVSDENVDVVALDTVGAVKSVLDDDAGVVVPRVEVALL
jgi:hypothetical protein